MAVATNTGSQKWDFEGTLDLDLYCGIGGNSIGTQLFWEDGLCEGFLFYPPEPPDIVITPIIPYGEGLVCFEMDALADEEGNCNELVDNSLQELEHLKRAEFWNIRNIAIRADSFGVPLTKLRYCGPFQWKQPIYNWYNDYFDIAQRYINRIPEQRVWAYWDVSKLYSMLYTSRREIAINYQGQYDAKVILVWSTETGKRTYMLRDINAPYDFVDMIDNNNHALPDKVMIKANVSVAALGGSSDFWGNYRTIGMQMEDRIETEFIVNEYHNSEGTVIRLPNYRDCSFNDEDLLLYNEWRLNNELDPLVEVTTISTTKDAYIYEYYPDNNYGTATTLNVGYGSGGHRYHTLIYFDISTIPTYHRIVKAYLRLYCISTSGIAQELQVWSLNKSWEENAVTWNRRLANVPWSKPGGDPYRFIDSKHVDSSIYLNPIYIDVTDIVKSWFYGYDTNYGFLIIPLYIKGSQYPANFVYQAEEHLGTNEPQLIIHHGDFIKVNNNLPVSASNPYIRDEANLWYWRSNTINDFINKVAPTPNIITITNSDLTSEVDVNISGYGDTVWADTEMDYIREETNNYTRTVGVPNSINKFSAQWGCNILDIACNHIGITFDITNSRYTTERFELLAKQFHEYTANIANKVILFDFGILAELQKTVTIVRPRDIEDLIRRSRKWGFSWIIHGWDYIKLQDSELGFWSSVSQANNDMGNTWEQSQWVPPETFNIQLSPETIRSTSLNLQHTIIVNSRTSKRHIPYATVHMTWRPLNINEMGFLQKAYQFGRVIQWDIERKYDISDCNWEQAVRIHIGNEIRYYGSHRSWRAGTVKVRIEGQEIYHNDPEYSWYPNYEEGYIVFNNLVPELNMIVELSFGCRLSLVLQSIVPADTAELYSKTMFLPVEAIFKEVR